MAVIRINLVPEAPYRRDSYGIPLVSETHHMFMGRGIHNRGFRHELSVWDNSKRPDPNGSGQMVDPKGKVTSERYSYLWSAQASVISARPIKRNPDGITLTVGDLVELFVHGYSLGEFQVRAGRMSDPHLVEVDTASSASRQHFIETGEYLAPGEEF